MAHLKIEQWGGIIKVYETRATVVNNQRVAPMIYQMTLRCPKIAKEAKPGQFITVKCEGGTFLWRPFSIAFVEKNFVYLFYQVVGRGTEWLSRIKKGNVLNLRGPLGGNGFTVNPEIKNPILVAGGIGIAPLIFLARSLCSLEYTAPLFLIGAKNESSIICPPVEYEIVGVRMTTEDGSLGYKGTVTELLENALSARQLSADAKMIYAAGPRSMLKAVAEIAKEHQIPCEVSLETIIACGAGACLGCAISTTSGNQMVCQDGPVFDAAKVVWDKYVPQRKILDTTIISPATSPTENVNLAVNIGGIELKNPVMPASGTFGYGKEFTNIVNLNVLGAIITKGITLEPRDGADQPRLCEIPQGMINRIGLQNPGVKKFVAEKMPFLRKLGLPIIVNICGGTVEDYVQLAKRLDKIKGIMGLQINISCPNTEKGGMAFGQSPRTAFEVVSAVREATSLPLITKLTPAVASIVQIAEAAVEAGTNALSAINTIPALGFVNGQIILGGQSGLGIKHIALRFIYELARAKLGVPLIACGGIMTWQDVVEFLMIGAQAVEIGTATFTNSKAMEEVIKGLENYLQKQGIKDINEIIGTALN